MQAAWRLTADTTEGKIGLVGLTTYVCLCAYLWTNRDMRSEVKPARHYWAYAFTGLALLMLFVYSNMAIPIPALSAYSRDTQMLGSFAAFAALMVAHAYVGYRYFGVHDLPERSTAYLSFWGFADFDDQTDVSDNISPLKSFECMRGSWIFTVAYALILGVVFGFMDNFGLFFGGQNLESTFYGCLWGDEPTFAAFDPETGVRAVPRSEADRHDTLILLDESPGGPLVTSCERCVGGLDFVKETFTGANDVQGGLGNTFSDMAGIFIGTAIQMIVGYAFGVSSYPWWIDVVSIPTGCLIGAFLPAAISDKQRAYKRVKEVTSEGFVETFERVRPEVERALERDVERSERVLEDFRAMRADPSPELQRVVQRSYFEETSGRDEPSADRVVADGMLKFVRATSRR